MLNDPNSGVREAAISCIEVSKIGHNLFCSYIVTTTIVVCILNTTTSTASSPSFLLVEKQQNFYDWRRSKIRVILDGY